MKHLLCLALSLLSMLPAGLYAQVSPTPSELYVRHLLQQRGIETTTGNELRLFFTGRDKFADLLAYIGQARHHVHLEYFNFRNDSIASLTFGLLGDMAGKGVEVRVMFDAFGNSSNNRPLKKVHLSRLRDNGVEIEKFDPIRFPWINHAFARDHRKIVVIDGLVGYMGGMNVADYYVNGLEGIGAWRDVHFRVKGPAVGKLQEIFLKMWNKETGQQVGGAVYYPTPFPVQPPAGQAGLMAAGQSVHRNVDMAIADRAPGKTSGVMRELYAAAIDSAQSHIQIVNPYFVPTHRVRKALKKALKRGIKVEIMLSAKSDIPFTPDAGEYVAHKLVKRGADVYLFHDGFHHSKVMMVDSAFCTIGTTNLNSRSLRYDHETNAFIFDRGVTAELTGMFERDKAACTSLDENYWKRRSGWKKFVGWLGNLFTPFL